MFAWVPRGRGSLRVSNRLHSCCHMSVSFSRVPCLGRVVCFVKAKGKHVNARMSESYVRDFSLRSKHRLELFKGGQTLPKKAILLKLILGP